MAHVMVKSGKMMSKHIDSYVKNVVHPTDSLDNGNFVALTGALLTNHNDVWVCATPSALTSEVFVIDEPVRNLIGGSYAIDVADPREFYVPAGRVCRARKLAVGDSLYVSAAGFTAGTPTAGSFAYVPAAGYTLAATPAVGSSVKVQFKIVATDTFFVGTESVSGYRLECTVANA